MELSTQLRGAATSFCWLTRDGRRAGRGGRYHAEILNTPTQVKNALIYVLQNARHHGELLPAGLPDLLCTSCWY